jgi:hypothetical protein
MKNFKNPGQSAAVPGRANLPVRAFAPAVLAVIVLTIAAPWAILGAASAPPAARAFATAGSRSAGASAFQADKGTFRILVGGHQVGKEEFEIAFDGPNWTARGNTEIHSDKATTHVTGTLTLRPDGTPVRYEWSMEGAKKASATVDFNGPVASIELHSGNATPFTQQFTFPTARIVVLDNNLYDQYAVLAQLYDWSKKGAQTFSVLVPQELTPGSATVESIGQQDFNGKKLEELRVSTPDNEIDLYLDRSRLVAISVPGANAQIVRQ